MKHLFIFEPEVEPEVEGGAPEPEGVEVGESAADGWTGPSQDEWEQLVQFQQGVTPFLSELAQALNEQPQQQTAVQEAQPELPEFDPFDPESIQKYNDAIIQQGVEKGIRQALEPYEGILGMVATEKGEALAKQELENIQSEVGQFDNDTAFLVAAGLIEQGNDPAMSLRRSAEYVRDFEARVRSDEREKYKKELEELASGGGDLPAGGGAATEGTAVPKGPDRYHVAIQNALERRRGGMQPVG